MLIRKKTVKIKKKFNKNLHKQLLFNTDLYRDL